MIGPAARLGLVVVDVELGDVGCGAAVYAPKPVALKYAKAWNHVSTRFHIVTHPSSAHLTILPRRSAPRRAPTCVQSADDPHWRAMMEELTTKQTACLVAIADHWERHGKAPTVAQIAIRLGVQRSNAHRLMQECRDKGYAHGPVTTGRWELSLSGRHLLANMAPKKKRKRA